VNSTALHSLVLDRAWIAEHIPHSGAMCLLDGVLAWSDETIRCVATSHRDADNPLRSDGRLIAICGIEYAAQAMAVHHALLDSRSEKYRPLAGLLASVRNVETHVERLDTLSGPLTVEAERISASVNNVLYRFTLHCDDRRVLTGRAAVVIDAASEPLSLARL
jgi:predicted hotdog family 3-hydroxylacyl-ACP dehydratase